MTTTLFKDDVEKTKIEEQLTKRIQILVATKQESFIKNNLEFKEIWGDYVAMYHSEATECLIEVALKWPDGWYAFNENRTGFLNRAFIKLDV
jgi:hypothetical protein